MKKNLLKLVLIFALILSVAAFMCACGGGSDDADDEGSKETTTEEAAPEEEEEMTLEKYFEENPDELKEIKDNVLADEENQEALELMDFDVYAEGNDLCYIYTFKNTYTKDQVDAMKDQFETSLDGIEAEMVSKISTIEAGFGVSPVTIHIEYLNGDGELISERDFKE